MPGHHRKRQYVRTYRCFILRNSDSELVLNINRESILSSFLQYFSAADKHPYKGGPMPKEKLITMSFYLFDIRNNDHNQRRDSGGTLNIRSFNYLFFHKRKFINSLASCCTN